MEEWRTFFCKAREQAKYGVYGDANIVIQNLKFLRDHVENLKNSGCGAWDQAKCAALTAKINYIISEIVVNGLNALTVKNFFGITTESNAKPSDITAEADFELPETPDETFNEGKPASKRPDTNAGPVPVQPKPATGIAKKPVRGNSLQPQSLDDFIGQAMTVARLKEAINAAKLRGENYIGNILLLGNRGLGKSTLMKLIAKELGVECHIIDASAVTPELFRSFLLNIAQKGQPVVIGVDEIHALKDSSQTMLLTLLNDRILRFIDKKGESYEIPVCFTFIGATTDPDKILQTVKDRCSNLTFYLTDYSHDELKTIFQSKFTAYGLQADDDVIEGCIARCRSSIREVEAIVKGLSDKAIIAGLTVVPRAMAEEYFSQRGLDEMGLGDKDREILSVLNTEENGGFLSADTLAARVHLGVGVLTSEYEPYLLKIGFIGITSRGRYLSDEGKKYIAGK